MIRKLIAIIILAISVAILLLAMDQSFINRIKQDRYMDHVYPNPNTKKTLYQKIFVHSDRWDYGDLFGISYLPGYKIKLHPFNQYNRTGSEITANRILYIIGDSFLADKNLAGAFNGFDAVVFLDRRFAFGPIKLDSTKQNYLVMEFAEMNLMNYNRQTTQEITWSAIDLKNKLQYSKTSVAGNPTPPDSYLTRLNNIIFNKDLSRNIETIIFDDKIFTPFKEAKAYLNYHLLGRTAQEVMVSTDKTRLLLNTTIDPMSPTSAFRPLSDQYIDTLENNLTSAADYYKSVGFKKVYLSVIPNSVTMYDSKRMPYNHLLERVEQSSALPLISVYSAFKSQEANLYSCSDVHWNPLGFDIWVAQARKALKPD